MVFSLNTNTCSTYYYMTIANLSRMKNNTYSADFLNKDNMRTSFDNYNICYINFFFVVGRLLGNGKLRQLIIRDSFYSCSGSSSQPLIIDRQKY